MDKYYFDVAVPQTFKKDEELKQELLKYDQDIAPTIKPDGQLEFRYILDEDQKRLEKGQIRKNSPHVAGIPLTYQEGDSVTTRDGRKGTVLGSQWVDSLVLYRYQDEPQKGFFLVKVDFGEYIEYHIRQDLSGDRFREL